MSHRDTPIVLGLLLALLSTACGGAAHESARHASSASKRASPFSMSAPTTTSAGAVAAPPTMTFETWAVPEHRARAARLPWLTDRLNALVTAPASMDVGADPDLRPIRVWSVTGPHGVQAVYVVGHADGECCPLISGELQRVVERSDFAGAWLSFGYAELIASGPAQQGVLAKLTDEVSRRSTEPACAGQLVVRRLQAGGISDASAEMTSLARRAYKDAASSGRPMMLWHDINDGYPVLVPALVAQGDALVPLEIRIPMGTLDIPATVKQSLSLDGVADGIRSLSATIAEIDRRVATSQILFALGGGRFETNYRAPAMIRELNEMTSRARTLRQSWLNQPEGPLRDEAVTELDAILSTNRHALAQAMTLPESATSNRKTVIVFADAVLSPGDVADLRRLREKSAVSLGKLRSILATSTPHAASRAMLVSVDAFLRGWPASFSSDDAERSFDGWMRDRQEQVWSHITNDLSRRGIGVHVGQEGQAPAELALSNVVFRVRAEPDAVVVTPVFVLAGAVIQVVDPDAKMVRYESLAADQNLSTF